MDLTAKQIPFRRCPNRTNHSLTKRAEYTLRYVVGYKKRITKSELFTKY
jgi:hypothetical protein